MVSAPSPALIVSAPLDPVMVSPWALPVMVKPSLWAPRLIVTPAAASAAETISTLTRSAFAGRVQGGRGRGEDQRVGIRPAIDLVRAVEADDRCRRRSPR